MGSVWRKGRAVFFGGVALAGIWLFSGGCRSARNATDVLLPVDEAPVEAVDHRPPEWRDRERRAAKEPLLDFEQLSGWSVESYTGGGTGLFFSTSQRQLWGDSTGCLVYTNMPAGGQLLLKPAHSIGLGDYFNTVDLWCKWESVEAADGAKRLLNAYVGVAVLLDEGHGRLRKLEVGGVEPDHWNLLPQQLSSVEQELSPLTNRLAGIAVEFRTGSRGGRVYFDSLSFYSERLDPLTGGIEDVSRAWTESQVEQRARDEGPNVRPVDRIDAPVTGEGATVLIREEKIGVYLFEAGLEGETNRFRIEAHERPWAIELEWNGRKLGRVDVGGFEALMKKAGVLSVARVEGHRLRLEYSGGLSLLFELKGRSLICQVHAPAGWVRRLGPVGVKEVVSGGQRVKSGWGSGWMPEPSLLVWPSIDEGEGGMVFCSAWLDWTVSKGSGWIREEVRPDEGILFPGVAYETDTRGRGRELLERLVVNVGRRLEKVWPLITEGSARERKLADHLWFEVEGDEDEGVMLKRAMTWRDWGFNRLIFAFTPGIWAKPDTSWSFREELAPSADRWGEWMEGLRSHGYQAALPFVYAELSPLNDYWHADRIVRRGDGSWLKGRSGSYAIKSSAALARQKEHVGAISERIAFDVSVIGPPVSQYPWTMTDYDERMPERSLSGAIFQNCQQMMREQGVLTGKPVIGMGETAWLYSGLTDGWVMPAGLSSSDELERHFELVHLQGCGARFGAGGRDVFEGAWEQGWKALSARLDDYLTAEISAGRCGRIFDFGRYADLTLRSYYMVSELQHFYGMRMPTRVAYWDGQRLLSLSEALAGDVLRRDQVYFRYPGDLEVWVNGSDRLTWEVRVGRDVWVIPPSGWVAVSPHFLELSVVWESQRWDYVETEQLLYVDSRGAEGSFMNMRSGSPLLFEWMEGEGSPRVKVTDFARQGRFALRSVPWTPGRPYTCISMGKEGKEGRDIPLRWEGDWCWVENGDGAPHYEIRFMEKE